MKFQFKSDFERTLFCVLVGIAVAMLTFTLYFLAISDPEALKMQVVVLLVAIACVIFGPLLVFETWLVSCVIKDGTTWPNVLLLIGICLYINNLLDRYGLLGAWMLFRKR